jgi:hypothetical protein
MANRSLSILGAFVLILSLAPAVAQTHEMTATIPFDFVVAQQSLPAGEYRLVIHGRSMLIRFDSVNVAPGPKLFAMYMNGGVSKDQNPCLIFNRYGNRYFLSRFWMGTTTNYFQLNSAPAEIGLARNTKPEETVILAKLLTK